MKNYIILLLATILVVSCTDNNDGDSINNELQGKWTWTELSGGIDGRTETPASTGSTRFLKINDTSVASYIDGVLQSQFNYTIGMEQSIITGEQEEMLIFENQFNQTIYLNGDTLVLSDECIDCYLNKYTRE